MEFYITRNVFDKSKGNNLLDKIRIPAPFNGHAKKIMARVFAESAGRSLEKREDEFVNNLDLLRGGKLTVKSFMQLWDLGDGAFVAWREKPQSALRQMIMEIGNSGIIVRFFPGGYLSKGQAEDSIEIAFPVLDPENFRNYGKLNYKATLDVQNKMAIRFLTELGTDPALTDKNSFFKLELINREKRKSEMFLLNSAKLLELTAPSSRKKASSAANRQSVSLLSAPAGESAEDRYVLMDFDTKLDIY